MAEADGCNEMRHVALLKKKIAGSATGLCQLEPNARNDFKNGEKYTKCLC